jgi:hypothetical protein
MISQLFGLPLDQRYCRNLYYWGKQAHTQDVVLQKRKPGQMNDPAFWSASFILE